ncbi:Muscle m-line assembly protein unc-89 [Gryllus bimaculatus]|nr:Muscle m-line assembly protein unc-89 [Gryllus bimaculatus]
MRVSCWRLRLSDARGVCAQEWFTLFDQEGKHKERYLFLFKGRVLVCKVRKISEDRSVFTLKDIIRLVPAASDVALAVTVTAHADSAKASWLKEILQFAPVYVGGQYPVITQCNLMQTISGHESIDSTCCVVDDYDK